MNVFLNTSVCLDVPPFLSTVVEKLCREAFTCWYALSKDQDDTSTEQGLSLFQLLHQHVANLLLMRH